LREIVQRSGEAMTYQDVRSFVVYYFCFYSFVYSFCVPSIPVAFVAVCHG
jgi:hypothetical protein